jgi:hypothetical protein
LSLAVAAMSGKLQDAANSSSIGGKKAHLITADIVRHCIASIKA